MMNKKAQRTEILKAIIVLFLIAVFTGIYLGIKSNLEEMSVEDMCRNSVKIASYKVSGMGLYENIKCPTQYQTITQTSNEEIKNEIAERMRKCYWMFGEGKFELFEEESENFCAVCYVLDFKEKKKITGLTNYLLTNKLQGSQISYYEYLTPFQKTEDLVAQTTNAKEDFIDTHQKYAIMFNYVKPGYISWLEAGGAAGGAGVATGLVITYFIPGVNVFSIVGTGIVAATGASGFFLGATHAETPTWSGAVMLWPYTEQEAKRLNCKYAPVETK